MKTKTILSEVSNGKRCVVDFKNKTVKLGKRYINFEPSTPCGDFVTELRRYYEEYKYSTPSKRTMSERRNYFIAVDFDELTTLQLARGICREVAKAQLELFVLSSYINGNVYTLFTNDKYWFWQDETLVILKDWF